MEAEDDETKDVKARVKRETKGYVPGGENVEDFDEEDISLTSEGKVRYWGDGHSARTHGLMLIFMIANAKTGAQPGKE